MMDFSHTSRANQKLQPFPPPVQLFHPVFQEFLDSIDDPAFEPDQEVVPLVSEPVSATTGGPLLAGTLDWYVGQAILTEPCTLAYKQLGGGITPLVFEYQRTLGEGGCDPLTRASYSVRAFFG